MPRLSETPRFHEVAEEFLMRDCEFADPDFEKRLQTSVDTDTWFGDEHATTPDPMTGSVLVIEPPAAVKAITSHGEPDSTQVIAHVTEVISPVPESKTRTVEIDLSKRKNDG